MMAVVRRPALGGEGPVAPRSRRFLIAVPLLLGVLGATLWAHAGSRATIAADGPTQAATGAPSAPAEPESTGEAPSPPDLAALTTPMTTLDDVLAWLTPRLAADPDGLHADPAIDAVVAWLRDDPRRAAALGQWLRTRSSGYDAGDRWARIVLAALGAAGLSEARTVLRDFSADTGLPPALRLHAVMHLARDRDLAAADVAALRTLAAEATPTPGARSNMAASGALAMLGTVASPNGAADANVRAEASAALQQFLRSEHDPDRLVAAAHGAGAALDPGLLPLLQPLLAHEELDVRAAAANAVAQTAEGLTASWALDAAAHDAAPRVRLALLEAALAADSQVALPAYRALAVASLANEGNRAVAMRLVALAGHAAAAGDVGAQAALAARFRLEIGKGSAADSGMLQAIGQYADARALAAQAAEHRP